MIFFFVIIEKRKFSLFVFFVIDKERMIFFSVIIQERTIFSLFCFSCIIRQKEFSFSCYINRKNVFFCFIEKDNSSLFFFKITLPYFLFFSLSYSSFLLVLFFSSFSFSLRFLKIRVRISSMSTSD